MLALFFTAIYVGLVVGVGALVGTRGNVVLSVVATAVFAVAFQPFRARASRLANRIVYGERATPYEVLSEFADRMGHLLTRDVLPRMAAIVGEGTGSARAEVWLRVGGELRRAAAWPAGEETGEAPGPARRRATVGAGDGPGVRRPGPRRAAGRAGRGQAALRAAHRGRGPAGPRHRLAGRAGAPQRAPHVAELGRPASTLVAAQEERTASSATSTTGPSSGWSRWRWLRLAHQARPRRERRRPGVDARRAWRGQAASALEELRDLAEGIYPPLLADHGLVAAVGAQTRRAAVPVTVEALDIGRYPPDVEAAVYFCVLEALQNVAVHRGVHRGRRPVRRGGSAVRGQRRRTGLRPPGPPGRVGSADIADRMESLGGSVEVPVRARRGDHDRGVVPPPPVD